MRCAATPTLRSVLICGRTALAGPEAAGRPGGAGARSLISDALTRCAPPCSLHYLSSRHRKPIARNGEHVQVTAIKTPGGKDSPHPPGTPGGSGGRDANKRHWLFVSSK